MEPLRIVVFGPDERVGVWEGDRVVDLNDADPRLPADLLGLIESGDAGLEAARTAAERALAGHGAGAAVLDAAEVQSPPAGRAPPADRLRRGQLRPAHARLGQAQGPRGVQRPRRPRRRRHAAHGRGSRRQDARSVASRGGSGRTSPCPTGPGDDILYPDRGQRLDYEGEVVAVIGRLAKDVAAGRGGEYIWGVSLHNDLSIRQDTPSKVKQSSLSFNLAKNWDGSASVGPAIVVGLDPGDVEVETRVNGELRQKYHSGDMIFSHADYIEFLSRDFVLAPGDMISGGSGAGHRHRHREGPAHRRGDHRRAAGGAVPAGGRRRRGVVAERSGRCATASSPSVERWRRHSPPDRPASPTSRSSPGSG